MQVVINDILTNYEVLGGDKKDKILILHGWGHNLNLWLNFAKSISETHMVYLVDLPGFGASSIPNRAYDIYDYSNFVESFARKLGLKNLTVIGHSVGGKIAIVFSSKSSVVKKLFLISPSGIQRRPLLISLKIILFKSMKMFIPLFPVGIRSRIFLLFAAEDYKNAGPLRETFKKVVNQTVRQEAKKIRIPTIIIWGENDKEVDPKYAKELRGLIRNSHIRVVWKTGHSPQLENPDKFNSLMSEYL